MADRVNPQVVRLTGFLPGLWSRMEKGPTPTPTPNFLEGPTPTPDSDSYLQLLILNNYENKYM